VGGYVAGCVGMACSLLEHSDNENRQKRIVLTLNYHIGKLNYHFGILWTKWTKA
jgi:hypothetical protein